MLDAAELAVVLGAVFGRKRAASVAAAGVLGVAEKIALG